MATNDKELKDELGDLPFLRKMKEQPGSGGFQVPKQYFKHLPDEVIRKAKEPVPAPAPRPNWLERAEQLVASLLQPRYALAFASVLVLVVAGVLFFGENGKNPAAPMTVRLEDISDEELFAYVSDNVSDFDHDLVLEATSHVLPEAKPTPNAKPTLPTTKAPKPEVEEMEEYLDEVIDEIDVEDLEELL